MNLFDDFIGQEMLRPSALDNQVAALDDNSDDRDRRDFVTDCLIRDIHEAKGEEGKRAAFETYGKFVYNVFRKHTESLVINDWEGVEELEEKISHTERGF